MRAQPEGFHHIDGRFVPGEGAHGPRMFTRDLVRAHSRAATIGAGACRINGDNPTPIEMPFRGVKRSGIGRENGFLAIDHGSTAKSVSVALGGVDALD